MSTAYHAKFFAYELTRYGGYGVERLGRTLFDASVDLNPHQIDAALFAFRNPISKGVLLADEVGLGKTIEAGIILCQFWAEKRRRLLVICPASLRKQWELELAEKFYLPTLILDAKAYRERVSKGISNPFVADEIVITSTHFASANANDMREVQWDLVVIDEAHKLRNAYRSSNQMGQNIRWALENKRKVLLTATPLQNSLLELYGLSTLIDEHLFGDIKSFRTQFVNADSNLKELRARLLTFCKRTLRRQVTEYIQYTERRLITQSFEPTEQEQKLYEAISSFLQRTDTYALPKKQRHLTALIVRKLLASSPLAVAATLETMRDRLIAMRDQLPQPLDIVERLIEEVEIEEELQDELMDTSTPEEDDGETTINQTTETDENEQIEPPIDLQKINAEIEELNRYAQWARNIGIDTKTRALITALDKGFSKMAEMGAAQRAVIFTESRRTQSFIKDFLEANGYAGRVITFNGTNSEPEATAIYERWLEANKNKGRATGSRTVDIRTAIIEYFRDHGQILIATEAGAEGINLQFCSLVINYDLPWNPQRIEQRIGRCHRYGQKHDVVVINFLNKKNEADCRVYELLEEKFSLFNGVFGASDEVLGAVEAGVDFESRILDIYQQCRTPEEIEAAFEKLRDELDEKINRRMVEVRQKLLEHFDEEVHARLKVNLTGAREQLNRVGQMFWTLTKFVLQDHANFDENNYAFDLIQPPQHSILPGHYRMVSRGRETTDDAFLYRLSHPLGEYVLNTGKQQPVPMAHVVFDITNRPARIALVEAWKGKSGWLCLQRLIIESFEREEYLLFSGIDDEGHSLDHETIEKMFHCQGNTLSINSIPPATEKLLAAEAQRHKEATISRSLETNNRHFHDAREKLEKWAEDRVAAAEKELKDTKERIKQLNRQARLATTTDEQLTLQKKIQELEKQKRRMRQRIFEVEDEIEAKRDELIAKLEKQMQQRTSVEPLFTIRWSVI
ncbi:helicase-like protein [Thermoflavifilum aggregans]|uniref:Helicase-like protein n=1 Tax=Thermoflavifilum aggregans TaxID=454188 RepID=A0A2M9CSY3_9BACT|nr:SNF2-related protein [Thermoflavifilum aggregans]PJJ75003.1 helicase-like protein [Thermoflavifilum aggregans]